MPKDILRLDSVEWELQGEHAPERWRITHGRKKAGENPVFVNSFVSLFVYFKYSLGIFQLMNGVNRLINGLIGQLMAFRLID